MIYATKPQECTRFYCSWLTSSRLGSEWKPLTAKMVVCVEGDGNRIVVHVDPSFPTNWRREPYYSEIKQWAVAGIEAGGQVVVYVRDRVIVVLPNKEVDLGIVGADERIMVAEVDTQSGSDWRAFKMAAKDVSPDQLGKWINAKPRRR